MIQLSLSLDDIDYAAASELLLPLLAEQLKKEHALVGGLLGSHAAEALTKSILNGMPQEKKDALLVKAAEAHKAEIAAKLESILREKNINLSIKDIDLYAR